MSNRLRVSADKYKKAMADLKAVERERDALTAVLEEARRRLDVGADPWQPPDAAERAVKFAKQFLDKALSGEGGDS